MKFEKRADGGEVTAPQETAPETGKKPVIVYILILFLAAFMLMAISLLAHQRSNSEALGDLRDSVSAMQEVQAYQDQIIKLQQQLDTAEKAQQAAEDTAEAAQAATAELEQQVAALTALYTLQQEYLTGDIESCRITLQEISDQGLAALLPAESTAGVTSPAERYQELKQAVLNH